MGRFDPARPDALQHGGTFNNDVLTMAAHRPSNQLFIGVWSIHVRCVEKRNAEFQRAMNRGN